MCHIWVGGYCLDAYVTTLIVAALSACSNVTVDSESTASQYVTLSEHEIPNEGVSPGKGVPPGTEDTASSAPKTADELNAVEFESEGTQGVDNQDKNFDETFKYDAFEICVHSNYELSITATVDSTTG